MRLARSCATPRAHPRHSRGVYAQPPLLRRDSITTGPDGNLWFTEQNAGRIGKMSPAGAMLNEYSLFVSGTALGAITTGPDGNVWFTENGTNRIGRITTSGAVSEFTIPSG